MTQPLTDDQAREIWNGVAHGSDNFGCHLPKMKDTIIKALRGAHTLGAWGSTETASPEPEWQECQLEDIKKGDKVQSVIDFGGYRIVQEGVADHQDYDGDWYTSPEGSYSSGALTYNFEDRSKNHTTLYRIPVPVDRHYLPHAPASYLKDVQDTLGVVYRHAVMSTEGNWHAYRSNGSKTLCSKDIKAATLEDGTRLVWDDEHGTFVKE